MNPEIYINVKRRSHCLGNALFDVSDYKVQDQFSVVSITTRYGLDGSRFEPRWGREIFFSPQPSRPTLGSSQPPIKWIPWLFSWVLSDRNMLTTQLHIAPRLMSRAVSVLTSLCLCDMLRRDFYLRVHSNVSVRMDMYLGDQKTKKFTLCISIVWMFK